MSSDSIISREVRQGFDRLPYDIRDIIFTLCLITDEVITLFPATFSDYFRSVYFARRSVKNYSLRNPPRVQLGTIKYDCELPSVALLAVNRAVRGEALPIFLGQNTFDLSFDVRLNSDTAGQVSRDGPVGTTETFYRQYGEYFRKINVEFSIVDVHPAALHSEFKWRRNVQTALMKPRETLSIRHYQRASPQGYIWRLKAIELCRLKNVHSVSIDIKDLYCPDTCCREQAIWHLGWILEDEIGGLRNLVCVKDISLRPLWTIIATERENEDYFTLLLSAQGGAEVRVVGFHNDHEVAFFMKSSYLVVGKDDDLSVVSAVKSSAIHIAFPRA